MRAPAFWWHDAGAVAAAMRPFAALYGAVAALRLGRPGEPAGVPILCIGNPTVGGAGKTPAAIETARMFAANGETPIFLTRGYGGRLSGPVLVDPAIHTAADVGDEPLLLARAHPTVVAHDRVAGARLARERAATVIVMDDGFQNPSLAKDCAVLVIDAARGIGNGLVIPAGPLRAPLDAQLRHAHALVLVGSGPAAASATEFSARYALPLFRAQLVPAPNAVAALRGRRVLAYAGIGDPEKFFATLAGAEIDVRLRRPFPDHHMFSADDALRLTRTAEAEGLHLVTTEKDLVRLGSDGAAGHLRRLSTALPVRMAFEDERGFFAFAEGKIKAHA